VTRWYLDSSAALKLVIEEAESAALAAAIETERPVLLGCWLLETEMRRIAARQPVLTQEAVSGVLDGINLLAMPSSLFREASYLPGTSLRSLDALHLAAAVSTDVDHLVTYDLRMAESARDLGLSVLAPT